MAHLLAGPSCFKGDVNGGGWGCIWGFYFTGSDRLFNSDLRLRSLNRRCRRYRTAWQEQFQSAPPGPVCLSDCLPWVVRWPEPRLLADGLSDEPGWLPADQRRDLDVKNTRSWLKLAFFLRPSSWWLGGGQQCLLSKDNPAAVLSGVNYSST